MAVLRIGFTAKYKGRGIFRRLVGSGELRATIVDVEIAEQDVTRVKMAVETVWASIRSSQPTKQRVGSLVDLTEITPVMYVRPT